MTTRLEVSNRLAPPVTGPVLSPKITSHDKGLGMPSNRLASVNTTDKPLIAYMQGFSVDKSDLKRALGRLKLPIQLLVATLQSPGESRYDDVESRLAEDILSHFSEVDASRSQSLYMGGRQICLLASPGSDIDQACRDLRSSARQFGCELTTAKSGAIESGNSLASEYRNTRALCSLASKMWGKPYDYSGDDVGLVRYLLRSPQMRLEALSAAQSVIDTLAKPKVLLPTLRLLLRHKLSSTEVAKIGRLHRNTVIYRINKVKQQTGLDPLEFNDAVQLQLALMIYDLSSLGDQDSFAEDSQVVSRALMSGLADSHTRRWLAGQGHALPTEFTMILVDGLIDSASLSPTVGSLETYQVGDKSLVICPSLGKSALALADELSSHYKVALLSSKELSGQLGRALVVLDRNLKLAKLLWPEVMLVTNRLVGCFGVFSPNDVTSATIAYAKGVARTLIDNPQLEATARVMLDASLSLTVAARRLKLHRNTLIYRVSRIKHLTGYDLTAFEDALQIRLALLLSELT